LPAYNTIVGSPSRILAGLVLPEELGVPPRFDVFDGLGEYLGTLHLSLGSSVLAVRGDRLLVRTVGPTGVPILEIRGLARE
jgi:hypothetical protein